MIKKDFDANCTVMNEYVMPKDTNALGILFGGKLFSLMDICAAIAVKKHTGRSAVTAGAENINFLKPSYRGDILTLKANILSFGNTSVKTEVKVTREIPGNNEPTLIAEGIFTFVII